MSSAEGFNYCYDVRRDLTPQMSLNCRTLYVNTAALLLKIPKAKRGKESKSATAKDNHFCGCMNRISGVTGGR